MTKILNIRKNCLGTLSLECKFKGMIKPQEFVVYPVQAGYSPDNILIQSDTRFGRINLTNGEVVLTPPRQGGSYGVHLSLFGKKVDELSKEELAGLKFRLIQTADKEAGGNGVVFCDNSGVDKVSIF